MQARPSGGAGVDGLWQWVRAANGLPLLACDVGPIRIRFSARRGGTSGPPWDSLNVGFTVGDQPDRVRANRTRLFEAVGPGLASSVWAEQVHGDRVAWVDGSDGGRGSLDRESAVPGADGLVTETRGLVLAMGFADCVPVAIGDPARGRLALCHAGWRGTARAVVLRALEALTERGSRLEDLRVAIGPAIGRSYRVDDAVMGPMRRQYAWADEHFDPVSGVLDLVGINVRALAACGVARSQVAVTAERTECPAFFSHRADHGETGRMAMLAWLAS